MTKSGFAALVLAALFVALSGSDVRAAGVVGTGSGASCTEAALDTALAGGGTVTFDCGGAATIIVTTRKTIAASTTIDGGNNLTISGGHSVGIFSVSAGVTFQVKNLTIADAQSASSGGGISNGNGSTLIVSNCLFSGNNAPLGGGIYTLQGSVTVTNSIFDSNSASLGGGAIYANNSTVAVANTIFSGNTSDEGGGITSTNGIGEAVLTVTDSIFSENHATHYGGAIASGFEKDNALLTVANSSFYGNTSGFAFAGGIENFGSAAITNSTFSGNDGGSGGAVTNGISNGVPDTLEVTNTTFSDNSGGIFSSGTATVFNTIIANSISENCSGNVSDGGHNIDSGTTCGFSAENSSQDNTDPRLDPLGLKDNGGPTPTIALCTGVDTPSAGCPGPSPAINAGDQTVCAATTGAAPVHNIDQRAFHRPGVGAANCSIGAFEANAPECGTHFDVTVSATSSNPFANILVRIDYANAPGEFDGSAATVACTSLRPGLFQTNDVDVNRRLLLALISSNGETVTPPADLFRCAFSSSAAFTPANFIVSVDEASDSDGAPVDVSVAISAVCSPCGNGTLDDGETCDPGIVGQECCNKYTCATIETSGACADDGTPCTTDVCNSSGICTHPADNAGVVCRPDTGSCDVAETCTGNDALCPADSFEPPGTTCGNPEDSTCDHADSCNGTGSCQSNLEADGTSCDDTDSCTIDQCLLGACVSTPDLGCPVVTGTEVTGEEFGTAVALTSRYLVVGAPATDTPSSGRVHVFLSTDDGYVEQTQTTPVALPFQDPDHATGNLDFGAAVDVHQDTIVVGAPFDSVAVGDKLSSGSASVFFFNGAAWVQQAKLVDASGLCAGFGTDVAVSGDTIVVGAPGGDCALVFQRKTGVWSLAATFTAPAPGVRFGQSVDVSGDTALVGVPGALAESGCSSDGKVHVYSRSGGQWSLADTLDEPVEETGGHACFGAAVGIDGQTGVIGVPFSDRTATDAGSAYVIEESDLHWDFSTELLAFPLPHAGDLFGSSLDIRGDAIIVGAPGVAAYIFERSPEPALASLAGHPRFLTPKWDARGVYLPPTDSTPTLSKFAFSVAIAPEKAAVGAPNEAPGGLENAGVVYPSDAAPAAAQACGDGDRTGDEECDDGNATFKSGEYCGAGCVRIACGKPTNSPGMKPKSGDALFALKASVGQVSCSLRVCDANGDGKLQSSDALRILRVAVGQNVPLSCPAGAG